MLPPKHLRSTAHHPNGVPQRRSAA